jgi:hypothetical protein
MTITGLSKASPSVWYCPLIAFAVAATLAAVSGLRKLSTALITPNGASSMPRCRAAAITRLSIPL